MEDYQIVELYWERSEKAISESDKKYGRMLFGISLSLLSSREDSEECVSDTYLEAWNKMPSDRPSYLGAYLSKIIRCMSVSRFREKHREKRGGLKQITVELTECIPDGFDPAAEYENGRLRSLLNDFLLSLSEEKRYIFVRRYFYSDDIASIAIRTGMSEAKIKTTLHRIRKELGILLEKEGLFL